MVLSSPSTIHCPMTEIQRSRIFKWSILFKRSGNTWFRYEKSRQRRGGRQCRWRSRASLKRWKGVQSRWFLVLSPLLRYFKYLSTQEGLWRARELAVLGFMDKEERAKLTERHALDLRRERCLLKMIKHRKRNKGEPSACPRGPWLGSKMPESHVEHSIPSSLSAVSRNYN